MKPRRWYSSPEANPQQKPLGPKLSPSVVYWAFTTRTRLEQGSVLKSRPDDGDDSPQRRVAARLRPRPPRLIDAA